jgi:ferredoxin, 2Fe-2S
VTPRAIYVNPDDSREELDIDVGTSLMQAALAHGLDGIIAECGGSAMCATCHVFVDEADLGRLPDIQPDEDEMLDGTAVPREHNSRLSCQLVMSPELDGITVRLPEEQL